MSHPLQSLLGSAGRLARQAGKSAAKAAATLVDADRALQASMGALIDIAAARYAVDPGATWKPGAPLKLLLAGYSGSRNTGADVRVEEMIRQFRHLFGDDHLELSILADDPELTRGYFRTVRQLTLPKLFPRFLFDCVHDHHGVIACEGSMFKSKFANALSMMMVGAVGLAAAENKIAVGYGGEAGEMDPSLRELVRRYCGDALVIARNAASADVLRPLGVRTREGTDTAWTFEPSPADVGRQLLLDAGWDGEMPVLAVCPINAFWWPVKADLEKAIAHATTGAHAKDHYASIYFHRGGPEVEQAQSRYIAGIADAVRRFRRERDVFPILVGMEQLDRSAAEALNVELGGDCALFVSDEYDMYDLVSVLRRCSMLVSSRYHAIVCSMPGLVPSAGITMDERIRNLMVDRGTPELALEVDDERLGDHLLEVLRQLDAQAGAIRDGIGRCVVSNLERMGSMGAILGDVVRARHPEFPFAEGLGEAGNPWAHLPPLGSDAARVVATYRVAADPAPDGPHLAVAS